MNNYSSSISKCVNYLVPSSSSSYKIPVNVLPDVTSSRGMVFMQLKIDLCSTDKVPFPIQQLFPMPLHGRRSNRSLGVQCPLLLLTCPKSMVRFTSLYLIPRDKGGDCHHCSVPSIAFSGGWCLDASVETQVSQT